MTSAQLATDTATAQHRTRLNAYRHSLTGQICIFSTEERAAFDRHCDSIREALAPVGALEIDLAQSIAEDRWRLERARVLESGAFALDQVGIPQTGDAGQQQIIEALAQARTWLSEAKNIQLLALYEQRIHRAVEKNMAELRALRGERQAVQQKAFEEAQLLAQLAYYKGETYDPAADFPAEVLNNGPDFSNEGINRALLRNRRMAEAEFYAKRDWEKAGPYPRNGVPIPIPSTD